MKSDRCRLRTVPMPYRPPVYEDPNTRSSPRRGSAYQQHYTQAWHNLARRFRRQHPLCAGCLAIGRTALAECVDHIIPHKGDPALMWDPANLQPACRWHHDVIKQRLELDYAQDHATADDLKLDSAKAI